MGVAVAWQGAALPEVTPFLAYRGD